MTDEEKAEEWVKSQMVHHIREQVPYFDFAIQAFLAGLEAGKETKCLRLERNYTPKGGKRK